MNARHSALPIPLALALVSSAFAAPPAAAAQQPSLREQQLEDLAFLERRYLPRERALDEAERRAATELLSAGREMAGRMSPEQFFLGLAQLHAIADNPHSLATFGDGLPATRLPIRTAWFDEEGLVVLRAVAPYEDLAGQVITRIDGRPIGDVMREARRYFGGPDPRRYIFIPHVFEMGGMLHAAGLAEDPARVRLTLSDRRGGTSERDVAYVPAEQLPATAWWMSRWWSPAPIPSDPTAYRTAIDPTGLPLYLDDADRLFRVLPIADLDALYIEIKTHQRDRWDRGFIPRVEREIAARRPRNLIIDLRFNRGGDLNLSAPFLQTIGSRVPADGRVFIIVGRYTFSAGIVAAAIAKNAAGARAVVVGEAMSDRLRFWSEGDSLRLPNSRYNARYTDGYFDLVDGCAGEAGCFRDNGRYDMVVGSLDPDLPAPMTTEAYFSRRDPAMDAIRAYLAR